MTDDKQRALEMPAEIYAFRSENTRDESGASDPSFLWLSYEQADEGYPPYTRYVRGDLASLSRPVDGALEAFGKQRNKYCTYCNDDRTPELIDGGWWHRVARGGDLGGTEPCKAHWYWNAEKTIRSSLARVALPPVEGLEETIKYFEEANDVLDTHGNAAARMHVLLKAARTYLQAASPVYATPYKTDLSATPYTEAASHTQADAGDAWQPAHTETPKGLLTNPDAKAWAAYFVEVFPGQKHMEDLMHTWFANAMMAMHDYLASKAPAPKQEGGISDEMFLSRVKDISKRFTDCIDPNVKNICIMCGNTPPDTLEELLGKVPEDWIWSLVHRPDGSYGFAAETLENMPDDCPEEEHHKYYIHGTGPTPQEAIASALNKGEG